MRAVNDENARVIQQQVDFGRRVWSADRRGIEANSKIHVESLEERGSKAARTYQQSSQQLVTNAVPKRGCSKGRESLPMLGIM